MGMNDAQRREIDEAVVAGNRALTALNRTEKCLDSASVFGLWDIFGGGMFSSMMKHSKIGDAQRCLEEAQMELRAFSRELEDVQFYSEISVKFDGVTEFIDIFCDNIFADVMVQNKIEQSKRNVKETKQQVQMAIRKLQDMRIG
ncbi:MAG: hypothetical protein LUI13_15105 [Lachnospiraceae bacterium]|nr:hypothetical protein [Lachnospiraceae bacterium]